MNNSLLFFKHLRAVLKKEILHLLRNPAVITISFLFPIVEALFLGYLLDINVSQINTVIYDVADTQASRQLIQAFVNSNDFKIVKTVSSDKELYQSIISGKAKVAIKIPYNFSKNLIDKKTSQILLLVDGSDATVTTEVVNVANIIALKESIKISFQALSPNSPNNLAFSNNDSLPLDSKISVLYNPENRSANFFLPGLLVFDIPSITVVLVALAFAVEKERGTLDQLFMTPINSTALVLGKILPYLLLAFLVMITSLLSMKYIYQVPFNGNPLVLLILSLPYLIIGLCLGSLVASNANTQMEAIQSAILVRVIPPLYLSGYLFPIESMPPLFQTITKFIPDRYFMEISRGVILRGAGISDLWTQELILWAMCLPIFFITALVYRRKFSS